MKITDVKITPKLGPQNRELGPAQRSKPTKASRAWASGRPAQARTAQRRQTPADRPGPDERQRPLLPQPAPPRPVEHGRSWAQASKSPCGTSWARRWACPSTRSWAANCATRCASTATATRASFGPAANLPIAGTQVYDGQDARSRPTLSRHLCEMALRMEEEGFTVHQIRRRLCHPAQARPL